MFSGNLLLIYLGVLIVLFILAMVLIFVSASRSHRNPRGGIDGPTNEAPIPEEPEHRNTVTRQDVGGTYGEKQ
ncbi:hypothetical protein KTT_41760 [Tengunoibacter tsumagoiensis]|uniref:Uncharacterized protein n=1 Tax=Tengunoibacter tsumagoiensis TaxID=2014871 RepID=A0A402A594_9CHLR|nr:hypothetical protein KTT_41760 [Tengunoibacter tsumagoiensis]